MKTKILNLLRLTFLSFATAVFLAPGASSAVVANNGVLAPEVRGVLERLSATGELSEADRATLLKYPEVANAIPDPESVTVEATITSDPDRAAEIGAQGCWITWAEVRQRSAIFRTSIYKFRHRADWCQDGNQVLGVHYRNYSINDVDIVWSFDKIVEDTVIPNPPAWEVKSLMKGHFVGCIPSAGCILNAYPWVELILRGDGSWDWRGKSR